MPDTSGTGAASVARDGRPPRDDLVRALRGTGAAVLRAEPDGEPSANANGMPTLFGHFTRFDEWTEIDSWYEGNFLERIAPGAFKKTFREQTPKVLFQHGHDPQIADKPLGPPETLREDDEGPYYEVPLLDTAYVRELVPGLEAELYGASFRFSVMREEFVEEPGVSDHNPKGLPERTIKEVRCSEFGPVTWPAYPGATAGVRSMTDEYLAARMTSQPDRLRSLLEYLEQREKRANELPPANEPGEHAEDCEGCKHPDCSRSTSSADAETESHVTRTEADTDDQVAPGSKPTPLYFGKDSRTAAPGARPTPLYTGKTERKGWAP